MAGAPNGHDRHDPQASTRTLILLAFSATAGVMVEFYDFFGKLLWVRTAVPVPSALGPGDTATLSLSTPSLDAARQTRYRFAYGAGASLRGRRPP